MRLMMSGLFIVIDIFIAPIFGTEAIYARHAALMRRDDFHFAMAPIGRQPHIHDDIH